MAVTAQHSHALFEMILLNDEIDLATTLPDTINLDYPQAAIGHGFEGALAVWHEGYTREDLSDLTRQLRVQGHISAEDQLFFKHIRARFKHLRFAFSMFDARHRYPEFIDLITSIMGNLQDAFKNEVAAMVRREAITLQILSSSFLYRIAPWQAGRFKPCTTSSFKSYIGGQAQNIRRALAMADITAHEFHETRKIISRHRAAFSTLSIMVPNENNRQIAQFLSTINGLMGNYHDVLMARKLEGTLDYAKDREALQPEMHERLDVLSRKLIEAANA
jgi:hypothetical protein